MSLGIERRSFHRRAFAVVSLESVVLMREKSQWSVVEKARAKEEERTMFLVVKEGCINRDQSIASMRGSAFSKAAERASKVVGWQRVWLLWCKG